MVRATNAPHKVLESIMQVRIISPINTKYQNINTAIPPITPNPIIIPAEVKCPTFIPRAPLLADPLSDPEVGAKPPPLPKSPACSVRMVVNPDVIVEDTPLDMDTTAPEVKAIVRVVNDVAD